MQSTSGNNGEEAFPNSVYEASKALTPNPEKDIIRRVQTSNPHEHSCKSS